MLHTLLQGSQIPSTPLVTGRHIYLSDSHTNNFQTNLYSSCENMSIALKHSPICSNALRIHGVVRFPSLLLQKVVTYAGKGWLDI